MPHRRLQNLYICLFLVLGAALCGAEIARQSALREQVVLVDYADSLREQGQRASTLLADAHTLAWRFNEVLPEIMISRLEEKIEALRSSHGLILSTISSEDDLDAAVTAPIDRLTPTLDEIENVVSATHPMQIAVLIAPLIEEYRAGLQEAAGQSFEQARMSTRALSALSLSLFGVIAGLLLIEALFLVIPASRSLRRQWQHMASHERQTARLSDKFRGLIESTSRIEGLDQGDEGTRIVLDQIHDEREPVVFDFTQLRAVQASLQLFEAAVTNSKDGVVIVEHDARPRIVYANDAMIEMTGRPLKDVIGASPLDLHEDDAEQRSELEQSLASSISISFQTVQIRQDGSRYHTEVVCIPVFDPGSVPRYSVLSYRDITGRVQAMSALQKSLERFELIGRVALDGIYDLDLGTGVCWRNEPLLRQFGKPDAGEEFFEWLRGRIHPDDAHDLIEAFAAFTRSERSSWEAEYRQLRMDGTWATVLDRASLLRDASGEPIRLIGSLQDITERREREWDLLQSENRLREILNDQTELVCRYDLEGRLTFVNHAYASYFQRSTEILIGTAFLELLPESEWPEAARAMHDLSVENPITVSEHKVILPDGSLRWQRWTDRVILDVDGQIKAYQAVGRDVTEEIHAKRKLEEAESRYRAFIRNSTEAIFRIELDPPIDSSLPADEQAQLIFERGVIAEANDVFSEQYGRVSAADSIGLSLRDLLGDDPENLDTLVAFARESYLVDDLVTHEMRADGSPVIFSNNTVGLVEDGKLVRVWGTQRDITEQYRAEQQLKQTNTMLGLFIEHAPAAVAMFDAEMRYIAASRRWIRDYGLADESLRGRSHYEVFPEISEEWKELHQRCLEGHPLVGEEDRFERADGSSQWIRWDIRPWYNEDGTVGGMVMFTEDITDRKRNADRLREINDQQTRLLTELDHRVKNALGGLLNLIEMGTQDTSSVQEYAESISRRVRSMASVHAMLSESSWKPLSLTEIVKNITPGDTPGRLVYSGADILVPAEQATPLAMVLQEFVSNSMKYGALSAAGGRVDLRWTRQTKNDHAFAVTLTWEERGGPPVQPHPEPGLGTQLVQGFAKFELRGSIELDYSSPEGVKHTLTCHFESDPE